MPVVMSAPIAAPSAHHRQPTAGGAFAWLGIRFRRVRPAGTTSMGSVFEGHGDRCVVRGDHLDIRGPGFGGAGKRTMHLHDEVAGPAHVLVEVVVEHCGQVTVTEESG